MRLKEESRQAKLREKRKEEAKNDIILQVCLIRSSDVCCNCQKCGRKRRDITDFTYSLPYSM